MFPSPVVEKDVGRARLRDNVFYFLGTTPASDDQVAPYGPESLAQILHCVEREGRVQAAFCR